MFPLRLLTLLFIAAPGLNLEAKRKREEEEEQEAGDQKEEEKGSKHDLRFQRGDLLEVPRTLFTHFGIYLGGGR